jgi:anaerobic glycerol-3-phosphate dehydrogenase
MKITIKVGHFNHIFTSNLAVAKLEAEAMRLTSQPFEEDGLDMMMMDIPEPVAHESVRDWLIYNDE